MKVLGIFASFFVLFFGWLAFWGYGFYFDNGALEREAMMHLEDVAENKASRVKAFLDERKADLENLGESEEVLGILKGAAVNDEVVLKLNSFKEVNGYLDLFVIDMDGVVLFGDEFVGVDLSSGEYFDSGLGRVFSKVKNDFGVGIFDPGYFEDEDELSIFVTSPVLVDFDLVDGKQDMVGVVALRIDNDEIENRVVSDVGLGKMGGEIYLVNRDGTLMSSFDVEKIDTEMFEDCFTDYKNYYFERQGENFEEVLGSGEYENYLEENVFGAHQYILESNWCVMVEVGKDDFYDYIWDGISVSDFERSFVWVYFIFAGALILGFGFFINKGGIK